MNDQAYTDDGSIPLPPPPPPPPAFDPAAQQGGQAFGDDQTGGTVVNGAVADAAQSQQYQQQYDPNFAHAPYDQYQAQQQAGIADPYGQQAGQTWQPDPTQQAQSAGSGGQFDPFAFDPAAQGGAQGMGQAGFDPMMGPPMGDDDGSAPPGAPPAPAKPSKPANFQLGTKLARQVRIKIPAHNLQFDENYFMTLLAGSISLTKDEKTRIIDSLPKLRQSQVDELIRIFEEEKEKFAELGEEHVPQLEKLAAQHHEDWIDIEMKQEQSAKSNDDQAQADEIRKSLGI